MSAILFLIHTHHMVYRAYVHISRQAVQKQNRNNSKGTYIGETLLRVVIRHLASVIYTKFSIPATNYSLERLKYLIGLNGPSCRAEANVGRPFGDTVGLMSHPSTFFGTQTSNRIWPRTPLGSMLGGWDKWRLWSSIREPGSLDSSWSFELGKKKWSLGLLATLLKLSFELAAALCKLQTECAILYSWSPAIFESHSWLRWQKVMRTFFSISFTAVLYSASCEL